ncbi:Sir2 family NAD-dependent protein deacetylase [Zhihengliuella flava]|uniref:protein acetyllysine N-acetyltransferase n=1 Tax=Zhihengliuella flava TaxID=1285193 RepID=A0A931D8Y4_9MICC|nr:Sir2 family NAD-dependent protein deacetylase [Zhihengliuella flava]MBG6084193.1 NAD-dependent SIR2 family protein deacetylase [Zhihengliuella flava]
MTRTSDASAERPLIDGAGGGDATSGQRRLTSADLAISTAHQAALRSIARVVDETAEPQDAGRAAAGLADQLRGGRVLVITGAGVSTDSGIPDYRGPNGSLKRHRPMTYQEFRHDPAARHRYWARSFIGWRHMGQAGPNRGHELLAEFERRGWISGIVTQNVDGLHAAAGSQRVIPLHGDLSVVRCLNCGNTEARPHLDARLAEANPGYVERIDLDPEAVNPDGDVTLAQHHVDAFVMVGCLVCSSVELKPDVVYFGENVPAERKREVAALEADSSSLLVVGSSLAVMSGYKIVLDAVRAGQPVGIINGGPSRADAKATWRWRTRVTPALEDLFARLA